MSFHLQKQNLISSNWTLIWALGQNLPYLVSFSSYTQWMTFFFSQTPCLFMIIFPFIPTASDGFFPSRLSICEPSVSTIFLTDSHVRQPYLSNLDDSFCSVFSYVEKYERLLKRTWPDQLKIWSSAVLPTLHNLRVDTIVPFLGWFVHLTTLWVKFLTSYTDTILIVQVA